MKKKIKRALSIFILSIFLTNSIFVVGISEYIAFANEISSKSEFEKEVEGIEKAAESQSDRVTSESSETKGVSTLRGTDSAAGNLTSETRDPNAYRMPETTKNVDKREEELKKKYGEPVYVSGEEQIFKVDKQNYITYIGSEAKTYRDENGVETLVDMNLVSESQKGNLTYVPKDSPVDISLPSKVDKKTPIVAGYKGESILIYPKETPYENAAVKDNALLYNNAYDYADVQYTVNQDGIKEEIILNSWEGKNTFKYILKTDDKKASLSNNNIEVRDKKGEKLLFVITAPLMVDNKGEESRNIKLSLSEKNDVYEITLTADEKWLSDSKRAYPVRIDPTVTIKKDKILDVVTSSRYGTYAGVAYGYVGNATDRVTGIRNGALGKTRMYFKINYDFSQIPKEARIDSATLNLYEYGARGDMNTNFVVYRLKEDFNISSIRWENSLSLQKEIAGANATSRKKLGFHRFDIRESVNGWVQGLWPNYGLVVAAEDEQMEAGAFYTTEAKASNVAQGNFSEDKSPSLTINWSVPDPVDINYPISRSTINLRNMVYNNINGTLNFRGVFADGLTTPSALVSYSLSDESKGYEGIAPASYSYKYPNSALFDEEMGEGVTKYRDKLSNWQSILPFTNPDENVLYHINAEATKNGETSGILKSDSFLIYKVTQFDTLPKIANYYGVPLNQIAFDNRIADMLLVKGNTLFIRNPKRNANRPYMPSLSTYDKRKIDHLLIGRGMHCEFGLEPINLNTGNFFMESEDINIPVYGEDFNILRTYNSKGSYFNSSFGRGWSFKYDEHIGRDEKGNIYYTRDDGSVLTFEKADGKYKAPLGYDFSLTEKKVGTKEVDFGKGNESYDVLEYHIKDESLDEERVFNFYGNLVSLKDAKGNVTELKYEGSQLSEIVSASNLKYVITMADNGYIGSILMPNGKALSYTYDELGRLTTFTNGQGDKISYSYNERDELISWSDGNGSKIIENTYDDSGRVTKQVDGNGNLSTLEYENGKTVVTDGNGNKTIYIYDENYRTTKIIYGDGTYITKTYTDDNRLSSTTDEIGRTTEYTYDKEGHLITETRPDGKTKKISYDERGNVVHVRDFYGRGIRYSYDEKNNLTRLSYDNGNAFEFSYDSHGLITRAINPLGKATTFEYIKGNLVRQTDALGNVTSLRYDSHNNVVERVNPLGGVSTFSYDKANRLISSFDSDGVGKRTVYDKASQVLSETDGNGNKRVYTYDAMGNVLTETLGGATKSYTYDANSNMITSTDGEGNVTTYEYDAKNNLTKGIDSKGKAVTYKLDKAGRSVEIIDELGRSTKYTYDLNDNVLKIVDPKGIEETYEYDDYDNLRVLKLAGKLVEEKTYDEFGRTVKSIDSAGLVTTTSYDTLGNILSQNFGERAVSYKYDDIGNLKEMSLPEGEVIKYEYTGLGNISKVVDPKGAETRYEYTKEGRLNKIIDALGNVTEISYDKNGNESQVKDALGNTVKTSYTATGNISEIRDSLGNTVGFSYSKIDEVTKVIDSLGYETKYEYDSLGNVTKLVDANGNKTAFKYTSSGELREVTNPDGSTTKLFYDSLDRVIKQEDSNGLITEYTYDDLGNVTEARDNVSLNEKYNYDDSSNLISFTDSEGGVTKYTYDKYNRLTKIEHPDGLTESYEYDKSGRLTRERDKEGKETIYTYDKNGNLLEKKDHLKRVTKYSYDELNRITKITDVEGNDVKYEYDKLGKIKRITDENGKAEEFVYDANSNLVLHTNKRGFKTVLKYDKGNRLISTLRADGAEEIIKYDGNGNILEEISGEGNVTSYTYDSLDRVISLTKPNKGVREYTYDENGALKTEKDANGNISTYENDKYGRILTKKLANGAEFSYTYDNLGRISKQTAPKGLLRLYSYDKSGNLSSVRDQSGRVTRYEYDKAGRLLAETNALNQKTKYTYDSAGNLSSIKTPLGYETKYSYTKADRLKEILSPTKRRESFSYDRLGNLIESKVGNRVREKYTYDENGNVTRIENALGQSTLMSYDELDRLKSIKDINGTIKSFKYDKDSRLKEVFNERGASLVYTYDEDSNITSVTTSGKRLKKMEYDKEDRLTKVVEGTGSEEVSKSYKYDAVGNVVEITSGDGKKNTFKYDELSNLIEKTNALGDKESYVYSKDNLLSKVTKADGNVIKYDYNKLDDLISTRYEGSLEGQVVYGYDEDGNRASMTDESGKTSYAYNGEGELLGVRAGDGSLIKYSYDEYGNISEMTYPDGKKVKYTYDELDRLTKVVDTKGKVTEYIYDKAGDLILTNRADGTSTRVLYNYNHEITRIMHKDKHGKEVSRFDYEYDDDGYIKKEVIDGEAGKETREYTYDSVGQISLMKLEDKEGKTSETTYSYDSRGNKIKEITKSDKGEEKISYTYDDDNRLLEMTGSRGTTKYEYDKNGNRISESSNDKKLTYSYDTENRLKAVKDKKGLLMAILYDGDGNRVFTASRAQGSRTYQLFKTVSEKQESGDRTSKSALNSEDEDDPDGEHSLFWYGFSSNLIEGLSSFGNALGRLWVDLYDKFVNLFTGENPKEGIVRKNGELAESDQRGYEEIAKEVLIPYAQKTDRFTYFENRNYVNDVNREHVQVLETYDSSKRKRESYTYGVDRISYTEGLSNTTYNYLTDYKGSVVGLSKDGKVESANGYALYGRAKEVDKTGNPYLYNGEARDISGLDYLRARYYDSNSGTFLTKDSYQGELDDPISQNGYAYVGNDPVNFVDPSGHRNQKGRKYYYGNPLTKNRRKQKPKNIMKVASPNEDLPAPLVRGISYIPNSFEETVRGFYSGSLMDRIKYDYMLKVASNPFALPQEKQRAIDAYYGPNTNIKAHFKTRIMNRAQMQNYKKFVAEQKKQQQESKSWFKKACSFVKRAVSKTLKSIDLGDVLIFAAGAVITSALMATGLGLPIALALSGGIEGFMSGAYTEYKESKSFEKAFGKGIHDGVIGTFAGFLGGSAGHLLGKAGQFLSKNKYISKVFDIGRKAGNFIDDGINAVKGKATTLIKSTGEVLNTAKAKVVDLGNKALQQIGKVANTLESKLSKNVLANLSKLKNGATKVVNTASDVYKGATKIGKKILVHGEELLTIVTEKLTERTDHIRTLGGMTYELGSSFGTKFKSNRAVTTMADIIDDTITEYQNGEGVSPLDVLKNMGKSRLSDEIGNYGYSILKRI